ncbi:MAG: hypothetical protein A2X83_09340 [Desulfuromonadales bacterium GWD2_54_10]|nr:MAG: hypothetical protein A2X83_09340 [Desulfuromonadales bacterium GWD2_54_10]
MTISEQKMLERCYQIELLCKELYEYFTELYADNEEAANLWRKTASEEQNHADQFVLALKLKKGLACLVTVDLTRVERIISQLRTVIEKVKISPPSFEDALNSAIKLEKYLAEFHLGCVVVFEDESCKAMFNAMMASDQEHIASLQAAYDKLMGIQDWTFTA